jgi:hypothetical protein
VTQQRYRDPRLSGIAFYFFICRDIPANDSRFEFSDVVGIPIDYTRSVGELANGIGDDSFHCDGDVNCSYHLIGCDFDYRICSLRFHMPY